jgi:hypothetical protein
MWGAPGPLGTKASQGQLQDVVGLFFANLAACCPGARRWMELDDVAWVAWDVVA